MAKGMCLSPITSGYIDDKGKNIVKVFGVGDKVELPDDLFADLVAAKAVAPDPSQAAK